jgi:hypothetical protein
MRRQYHSRRVGDRNFIWDVNRLLDLTREHLVVEIPLSRISELDEGFWFGTASPTCRAVAPHAKLIQDCDLTHPIILSSCGRVMDGMHRVCRALIEGRPTIAAVQFTTDPEPDYIDVDIETLPYDEP